MTNIRTALAVTAGNAASLATRVTRRGGGTAVPGLIAERFDPSVVANLGRQLGRGRIVVTGTNGKTTTSRMIAEALTAARIAFVHNREGSNLMRGMASTLVARAGIGGSIRGANRMAGLFETDEATMPAAVAALQPGVLVFTNLFRDQLDRYGEVDSVAGLWREALAKAPRDATLVLNADDPSVAEMATGWPGPVHWFGLDDEAFTTETAGAFDARWCACGGDYRYDRRYFAHVGYWRCTNCDRKRPNPDTSASGVKLSLDGATMTISGLGDVSMPLTGLYNVYNALAAAAACAVFGVPEGPTISGLARVKPAFGRQEQVEVQGRRLRLFLAKNPAGANQVLLLLREVARTGRRLKLALLLNDRFADGQDVSWIWDVDYELLGDLTDAWWAGGDRAEDLAVRLKYAGYEPARTVEHDPAKLLDAIVTETQPGDDVFVIPTYTAMLDFRSELARRGAVAGRMD
ncbi:MAG: MurT ligase domain-containing protein [Dehalococcoidia bacterium]